MFHHHQSSCCHVIERLHSLHLQKRSISLGPGGRRANRRQDSHLRVGIRPPRLLQGSDILSTRELIIWISHFSNTKQLVPKFELTSKKKLRFSIRSVLCFDVNKTLGTSCLVTLYTYQTRHFASEWKRRGSTWRRLGRPWRGGSGCRSTGSTPRRPTKTGRSTPTAARAATFT